MLNLIATGPFMRHFYTLQKILQKRPNRSSIVQAAVYLSKTAADLLLNSVREKKATASRSKTTISLHRKEPEIISVIRSVECAYNLIYQALGKISGPERDKPDVSQVIYHIVCLYNAAMKTLEQYCKTRAEQLLDTTKSTAKSAKQKQNSKFKRSGPKPDDEIAGQIIRLLGTMILSLDVSFSEHQDLLEGAVFILLNRVGRLLCLFVFQDLQVRPDLRIDPWKLPLPHGLKDVELNEKSLCTAKMEAKHLIWVLERILTYLDSSPPSPSSRMFTSKIKESLQNTLLQAVFGTDDKFFQKSLQCPVLPDTLDLERLRACAQIPEQAVPDWFTQEVWRLLGWDILMSKNQAN